MAQGPQKPDHGGNFFMMPRRVQDSVAWRKASLRARVVLSIFLARHNGFNNGAIRITIREIGEAIGDQNHGANGKAVAELIQLGFLECTADASHKQSKAREYRITFIPTGEGKRQQPATNEYVDWRPGSLQRKKFGAARTATPEAVSVAVTATSVKISVADTATSPTENRGFEGGALVAVTAPLIVNQSSGQIAGRNDPENRSCKPANPAAANPSMDLEELRAWTRAVVQHLGNARPLARDSGVPEPALSRFRAGKNLPGHYRLDLQMACGRVLPFVKWKAAAA